ncbi:hypothetical protein NE865_10748 [Phthorimaea operculella]|nr:hypothetical protein NE865_10748 [Phthorimaea operculella]
MAPIATYVFFDFEVRGPRGERKITELSLVAVKREQLLNHELDIQNDRKLTLKYSPPRVVPEGAVAKPPPDAFNREDFDQIISFLNQLPKPVCGVAYNGIRFDFPILKMVSISLDTNFPNDMLFTDGMYAFYDILNDKGNDNSSLRARARSDRFPWPKFTKPNVSYQLEEVYKRVVGHSASAAHTAEYDSMMMIEIASAKAELFVSWVDKITNQIEYRDFEMSIPE